jgi:hypothetical protein
LDTSPGGSLRREWEAAVGAVASRVGTHLESQLASVGALLSAPHGDAGTVRHRAQVLGEALGGVDRLRAQLDAIRARAEALAV